MLGSIYAALILMMGRNALGGYAPLNGSALCDSLTSSLQKTYGYADECVPVHVAGGYLLEVSYLDDVGVSAAWDHSVFGRSPKPKRENPSENDCSRSRVTVVPPLLEHVIEF